MKRILLIAVTLIWFTLAGEARAGASIPRADIARMNAVYPSLILPNWMPSGYVYIDWSPTSDPMNKTGSYDAIRVEFADKGAVVSWNATGLAGHCARAGSYPGSAVVPFTKLLSDWTTWTKAKGPNFPQSPSETGFTRFGNVVAYTTLGNHTQIAWACFGNVIVTVGFDGGMPDANLWMRAAASGRKTP